jgi:hypothetical protein
MQALFVSSRLVVAGLAATRRTRLTKSAQHRRFGYHLASVRLGFFGDVFDGGADTL